MEIKALVIDDEPLALELIKQKLSKFDNIDIIGSFNYFDLEENKGILTHANTIFIDIEMPVMNGLDLAELILEVNPNLLIVFVTAFKKYMSQALEKNAFAYLLKPVDQKRLAKTVELICEKLSEYEVENPLL